MTQIEHRQLSSRHVEGAVVVRCSCGWTCRLDATDPRLGAMATFGRMVAAYEKHWPQPSDAPPPSAQPGLF